MKLLRVEHSTVYRYRRPVAFDVHRLMLRPRDGHDLRVLAGELEISPSSTSRWVYDVLGNSVTLVSFLAPASELRTVSRLTIERYERHSPRGEIEASASYYPFIYSMQDRFDLARMLDQHYPDPANRVGSWAQSFILGNRTDTLALLGDLNAAFRAQFDYRSREEEGTQTPAETLERRSGSCRDFAVLLVEAARSLGFGARVVTGYVCSEIPAEPSLASQEAGTTHAWAEIFVPGPGWIAFDPLAVRVGHEPRGLAELYFEAINQMDEAARKMELALVVVDTLKAKVPQSADISVIASFINDVPGKVIIRQAARGKNAKAKLVVDFVIPSATPAGA